MDVDEVSPRRLSTEFRSRVRTWFVLAAAAAALEVAGAVLLREASSLLDCGDAIGPLSDVGVCGAFPDGHTFLERQDSPGTVDRGTVAYVAVRVEGDADMTGLISYLDRESPVRLVPKVSHRWAAYEGLWGDGESLLAIAVGDGASFASTEEGTTSGLAIDDLALPSIYVPRSSRSIDPRATAAPPESRFRRGFACGEACERRNRKETASQQRPRDS